MVALDPCSPLFIFRWLGWHFRSSSVPGAVLPSTAPPRTSPVHSRGTPGDVRDEEGLGEDRIVAVRGWDRTGEAAATWAPSTPRGTRRLHPRRAGARARRAGAHEFSLIARGQPLYPVIGAKSIVLWKVASLCLPSAQPAVLWPPRLLILSLQCAKLISSPSKRGGPLAGPCAVHCIALQEFVCVVSLQSHVEHCVPPLHGYGDSLY